MMTFFAKILKRIFDDAPGGIELQDICELAEGALKIAEVVARKTKTTKDDAAVEALKDFHAGICGK